MKLIHIVGCRPNFIKLAPVYRAAKDKFEQIIIHTGQHYNHEMSQMFFDELELPEPNVNLGVKEKTHAKQTARMLEKIEDGLLAYDKKDCIVVVYGDTNSSLAGALAAKKMNLKVAHIEAGVYADGEDNSETVNRGIIDSICGYLKFSPIFIDGYNLGPCRMVGDVMYDQFLWAQDKLKPKEDCEYILVTIHREENTIPERLDKIDETISNLDGLIYWPRHPRTENPSPISYLEMLSKIRVAKLVITDSGGVQKEAFWFKVPCLTVRKQTEWIDTIQSKWNTLCEPENLIEAVANIKKPETWTNPYGDGGAAERIVNILCKEENHD